MFYKPLRFALRDVITFAAIVVAFALVTLTAGRLSTASTMLLVVDYRKVPTGPLLHQLVEFEPTDLSGRPISIMSSGPIPVLGSWKVDPGYPKVSRWVNLHRLPLQSTQHMNDVVVVQKVVAHRVWIQAGRPWPPIVTSTYYGPHGELLKPYRMRNLQTSVYADGYEVTQPILLVLLALTLSAFALFRGTSLGDDVAGHLPVVFTRAILRLRYGLGVVCIDILAIILAGVAATLVWLVPAAALSAQLRAVLFSDVGSIALFAVLVFAIAWYAIAQVLTTTRRRVFATLVLAALCVGATGDRHDRVRAGRVAGRFRRPASAAKRAQSSHTSRGGARLGRDAGCLSGTPFAPAADLRTAWVHPDAADAAGGLAPHLGAGRACTRQPRWHAGAVPLRTGMSPLWSALWLGRSSFSRDEPSLDTTTATSSIRS